MMARMAATRAARSSFIFFSDATSVQRVFKPRAFYRALVEVAPPANYSPVISSGNNATGKMLHVPVAEVEIIRLSVPFRDVKRPYLSLYVKSQLAKQIYAVSARK